MSDEDKGLRTSNASTEKAKCERCGDADHLALCRGCYRSLLEDVRMCVGCGGEHHPDDDGEEPRTGSAPHVDTTEAYRAGIRAAAMRVEVEGRKLWTSGALVAKRGAELLREMADEVDAPGSDAPRCPVCDGESGEAHVCSPALKEKSAGGRENPCATSVEEREVIANYVAEHAVLLSGHVRKPWLQLAEEIRAGAHWFDARATPCASPDFNAGPHGREHSVANHTSTVTTSPGHRGSPDSVAPTSSADKASANPFDDAKATERFTRLLADLKATMPQSTVAEPRCYFRHTTGKVECGDCYAEIEAVGQEEFLRRRGIVPATPSSGDDPDVLGTQVSGIRAVMAQYDSGLLYAKEVVAKVRDLLFTSSAREVKS